MERTDEQLMMDFQKGDNQAMELIFDRYKVRIINFCFRLLDNRDDAEEASSEVFLSLFKCKYAPDSNAKFSTWLYTIARNQCITQIRKRKNVVSMWVRSKDQGSPYEELPLEDTRESSQEQMIQRETQVYVKLAIKKLPFEQKQAIVLRQYHGFSYQEISLILNCSLEKVKVLIFRAKEQLRVELTSFIKEDNHE